MGELVAVLDPAAPFPAFGPPPVSIASDVIGGLEAARYAGKGQVEFPPAHSPPPGRVIGTWQDETQHQVRALQVTRI